MNNKHALKIEQDSDATSPRDNDNLGTLACWHRRYTLGDLQPQEAPMDYEEALPKDSLVLPVYMIDHSGIALSLKDFGDPWDSGQVGIYHMSPSQLIEEYGEDTPEIRERATSAIKAEIEEYSEYVNGNCWGFVIEDENGNTVDSCWGFIGSDIFDNGMIEHIDEEYYPLLEEACDKAGVSFSTKKLEEYEARCAAYRKKQRVGPASP